MKVIAQTPLEEIRKKEEEQLLESYQVQALGLSLTQEKLKNIEKDKQILALGEQVSALTLAQMDLQKIVNNLGGK